MVDNLARSPNSPGAGLPPIILEGMIANGYRPSLRKLASIVGIPAPTLGRNFDGLHEMTFSTAKKLSEKLNIPLEELAKHV